MKWLSWALALLLVSPAQAAVLSGVVLQENGQPAPGATVNVAGIFRSPPLRLTTTADDRGQFRIEVPPLKGSARYMLAVRWQMQGADVTETVDSTGKPVGIRGQTNELVNVRLREGGELRGRLFQAEDDAPLPGARLYVDTGEVLTTDENGAFRVRGLPMRDHSLIPVARGRVRQYVLFDTTLRPDAELDIRLPRGAVIKGTITDEAGQPIPGAFLTRASSGTALTLNGWNEVCDSNGAFEYGGLSTERLFYNLEANAPGYQSRSISSDVTDVSQVIVQNITLTKAPAAPVGKSAPAKPAAKPAAETSPAPTIRRSVAGVVRDEAGNPIANAVVRWAADRWDDSVKRTTTSADGAFTLANVPEGDGAVLVLAKGFAPQFASVKGLDQVRIVLTPGVSVRGIVRNRRGVPVSGAHIILVTHCLETGFMNPIWLDERSARSDGKGAFEILNVPAAGVAFDILKEGYGEQRDVRLNTGDQLNEVQLEAGGAITGWVLKGPDAPVRDFRIRVMIPRQREQHEAVGGYYAGFDWYGIQFTRNDGVFTFTDINAAHWLRLIISSPGVGYAVLDRVQSESLDALSPPEDLTITLKPFRPLTVTVTDENGRPLKDARVGLLEDEPGLTHGFRWGSQDLWCTRQSTGIDGKAVFPEPACDDGVLTVSAAGYGQHCLVWDGAPDVTVALSAAATLNGEVRVGDRKVESGWVMLERSGNISFGADLKKGQGRFEWSTLPHGDYTIRAEVDGRESPAETISLKPGESKTHDIKLPIQRP